MQTKFEDPSLIKINFRRTKVEFLIESLVEKEILKLYIELVRTLKYAKTLQTDYIEEILAGDNITVIFKKCHIQFHSKGIMLDFLVLGW